MQNPYLEELGRFYPGVDIEKVEKHLKLTTFQKMGFLPGEAEPILPAGLTNRISIDSPHFSMWRERERLVRKYAWAIPSEEAIQLLVKHGPIIDIPAGKGYWSWMIKQAGGSVVSYDEEPNNLWANVSEGNEVLVRRHPRHTLFLCWPPYSTPMAYSCLKNYRGNKVIYVGEGSGGCTGDDRFHDMLQNEFEVIEAIDIPRYDYINDSLWVYQRKVPRNRHWTFYRK